MNDPSKREIVVEEQCRVAGAKPPDFALMAAQQTAASGGTRLWNIAARRPKHLPPPGSSAPLTAEP
jgi:hypothetical protein